ncbi:MAG: AmmeMemoRadiSam system protein B [Campylobacterales bacterium]|nr:AmmeMemoRadiSam system protein B [Campylobacterales bacterium]
MTRLAKNSGRFYSDSCQEIENQIHNFNRLMESALTKKEFLNKAARVIIAPHAGYIYSGFSANIAHRLLGNSKAKRVIVIGPSHYVAFHGISGSFYERYASPCGYLPIDTDYLETLAHKFTIGFVEAAHKQEHSTETQIPLIQHYSKDKKVIEFIYGRVGKELKELIGFLLEDKENAIVISTDLSHFYDLDRANKIDKHCLDGVYNKDLSELKKCEACGKSGVEAIVTIAKEKNFNIELLDYRTSYDQSRDKSSVVGYMSACICEDVKTN